MPPFCRRRETPQGINRFMVVTVLADHMQALPAVRPRSPWVHGHPDKPH
ncbi:hypothetical protein HMPREF1593_02861 [Escherichia coli 907391]|nr:hypothetical protein HMPREF1593_02861 [Escherichia coli 907391]DAR59403.1 MAG TPA: hypothetical protein [Bacteriophage sp.]